MKNSAKWILRLLAPFLNPVHTIQGFMELPNYVRDWRRYARMSDAESLDFLDAYPQLHDKTKTTGVDRHYFYANGWAMRRIWSNQPERHVDIGSSIMFVNLLSAVLPVTFVDYRPLKIGMEGLNNQSGDILNLPFEDGTVASLSCLHVAEHIGLGRYGDPLNPLGTQQACAELTRILESRGRLYFAVPIGRPRVCYNAHRIHSPETIVRYFDKLDLVEFSAVCDDGQYLENVNLDIFADSRYACGMFYFRKP